MNSPYSPQKKSEAEQDSGKSAGQYMQKRPFLDASAGYQGQQAKGFFRNNMWAVWLIALSVLLIAALAYFIFKAPAPPPKPNVSLKIESPEQIDSGKEIIYRLVLENNEATAIKNISVDMLYPPGFTFSDSSPQPTRTSGAEFAVPSLNPRENAVIIIRGAIVGNAGETKAISAIMHYNYANFNSQFSVQGNARTDIKMSNLVMHFEGLTSTNVDQSIVYDLVYSNKTDQALRNIKIRVTLPKNFNIDNYEPKPSTATDWDIDTIAPGVTDKIRIVGTFKNLAVGDQAAFFAEAYGTAAINGSRVILSSANYAVSISVIPLSLEIRPQADVSNVEPGASLTFQIVFRNARDIPIHAVVIRAIVDSINTVEPSSLAASNAVINGNVISWDAAQVDSLTVLQPNQEGSVNYRFKLKNPVTRSNIKNVTLRTRAVIASTEYPQGFSTPDTLIKVRTIASFDAKLKGIGGALPPRVGQPSTYSVSMEFRNSTNDIEDASLSFNLPNTGNLDLSSINSDERGHVTYDPSIKRLSWDVGKISAHTGDFNPVRKLVFDVTIVPDASDLNKTMLLINRIKGSGIDKFVNHPFKFEFKDVDTGYDQEHGTTVRQ